MLSWSHQLLPPRVEPCPQGSKLESAASGPRSAPMSRPRLVRHSFEPKLLAPPALCDPSIVPNINRCQVGKAVTRVRKECGLYGLPIAYPSSQQRNMEHGVNFCIIR
ncbi:hypothetical protein CRG98_018944 [Punica granatum]|uniref:Uncharacterized protein n=1 Tax=Punica granatum TaxID=22663 RepID=A0A2I0JWK2_PUNGR|nr:hypothetical protein CRG98_018944 [Punica granatum]